MCGLEYGVAWLHVRTKSNHFTYTIKFITRTCRSKLQGGIGRVKPSEAPPGRARGVTSGL